jgi:hypothetical protein
MLASQTPPLLLTLLLFSSVGPASSAQKSSAATTDEGWMNFEDLFLYGKDAYLANDWAKCARYFERAVDKYRDYVDKVRILEFGEGRDRLKMFESIKVSTCKRSCRAESGWESRQTKYVFPNEDEEGEESNVDVDDDLRFFSKSIKHTHCLIKCKKEMLGEDDR